MAWKRGQSGNPAGGAGREKIFADQVRIAVNIEDPDTGKRKLRIIAEKLVESAAAGEAWAIQQVADRLDGKPAQESTVNVNDQRDRMSDAELRELIASAIAGAVSGGNGAAKPQDTAQLN